MVTRGFTSKVPSADRSDRIPPGQSLTEGSSVLTAGLLKGQCLDRRIDTREGFEREIAAWERRRNAAGARVRWMFTTENARAKMGRLYPKNRPARSNRQRVIITVSRI